MKVETVHLKEHYPILGAEGKDPLLVCYMPDNLTEMGPDNKRHRAMVVCPCDGYAMVSQREAEPIALNLMAYGFLCVYADLFRGSPCVPFTDSGGCLNV